MNDFNVNLDCAFGVDLHPKPWILPSCKMKSVDRIQGFEVISEVLSKPDDRCYFDRRGKSELRRAGCWVTPSEGDLKESATERYR